MIFTVLIKGDAAGLLLLRQTGNQEVAGSTPTWAMLCNNIMQVVHTAVPLSPSSRVGTHKIMAGYGKGVSAIHNTEC